MARAQPPTIIKVPAEFPTIQAAVAAAAAEAGPVDIRVAAGHHVQRLHIRDLPAGEKLEITGGWDPTYTENVVARSDTTLDGGGVGPVVMVTGHIQREVDLAGFTIVGGHAPERRGGPAGGLYVSVSGNSRLRFDWNVIRDHRLPGGRRGPSAVQVELRDTARVWFHRDFIRRNHVTGSRARAAGLRAVLRDDSGLNLERNHFVRNQVRATSRRRVARAAGAEIRVLDTAQLVMGGNLFEGNRASGAGAARYAALTVTGAGHSEADLGGNCYFDNRTESDRGDARGTVLLAASSSATTQKTRLDGQGEALAGNFAGHRNARVVSITNDGADVSWTSSLVVRSRGDAIRARARAGSLIHLTNLTITGNSGRAVRVPATASGITFLSNSILAGNGTDVPRGGPVQTANLVGGSPLFVDPAGDDYHLQPGSPAIDAGNNSPPGGLDEHDLEKQGRTTGAAVDLGAYELRPGPWLKLCESVRKGVDE
jgi:hypothetical protein